MWKASFDLSLPFKPSKALELSRILDRKKEDLDLIDWVVESLIAFNFQTMKKKSSSERNSKPEFPPIPLIA